MDGFAGSDEEDAGALMDLVTTKDISRAPGHYHQPYLASPSNHHGKGHPNSKNKNSSSTGANGIFAKILTSTGGLPKDIKSQSKKMKMSLKRQWEKDEHDGPGSNSKPKRILQPIIEEGKVANVLIYLVGPK